MAAFVPKKYGDLGKQYKDLLKNDFDYDNCLKVKRKTACGLKFDSTAKHKKKLEGSLKASFKDAELGDMEFQASTSNKFNMKLKLSELADGLKSTIKAQLGGKVGDIKTDFSVTNTFDYSQENFTGSLETTLNERGDAWTGNIVGSVVVGTDGVSLGATFSTDVTSDMKMKEGSSDYNVAFELAEEDFTLGLATESSKKGEPVFKASWHHNVSKDCVNAVLFENNDSTDVTNTMTLCTKYAVDDVTDLKVKASTAGIIDTAITYTLGNPSAKLNFATQFKTSTGTDWTFGKFGLGITLGSI
jgi:hypothetical protein